jgi:acyl-CoA synthetase (AMP-forming)/AMP-acid ligase II
MLYHRWLRIARAQSDQVALFEVNAARRWTFGELLSAAENQTQATGPVAFPQGDTAEFIIEVLAAWRIGQVVCPVERGHCQPAIQQALPPGIVHLKTTSATTGQARLVAFTANQLIEDAENIILTMGLRADWPNLAVISLAHSYGFSNLVLPLLLHGVPLILVGSALPEAVRSAAAAQTRVTLAAVPALWQTWDHAAAIPSNVRLAISAGAPLPLALEQSIFEKYGLKIHNFYGSSECGGIAYDSTPLPRTDGTCAGMPLRNVAVMISEDGCVEVRSAAVGESYWPESSPELRRGIFRTSDVGCISDGVVYLSGRVSDQINVAGRKVLPETIEAVLTRHPQVRACLAFGVPSSDTQRGETIVACVAADEAIPGEGLRQFALANLPAWQVPRDWWFVHSLEPNGRGKLSRAEWRKRYLEEARGSSPLKVSSPRKIG